MSSEEKWATPSRLATLVVVAAWAIAVARNQGLIVAVLLVAAGLVAGFGIRAWILRHPRPEEGSEREMGVPPGD